MKLWYRYAVEGRKESELVCIVRFYFSLGLSHDGEPKSQNDCNSEIMNIMAPMVTANFNLFTWSGCSRREFHRKAL